MMRCFQCLEQIYFSPEHITKARTQLVCLDTKKDIKSNRGDSSEHFIESVCYVTTVMSKRSQHVKTALYSKVWEPGWTLPLTEVVPGCLLLNKPHDDLRETFERSFSTVKHPVLRAIPGSERFKRLLGILRGISEGNRNNHPH